MHKIRKLTYVLLLLAFCLTGCHSNKPEKQTPPTENSMIDQIIEKIEQTEQIEHTHTYIKTVIEPTCVEKGYTIYTCDCGHTKNDNYIDELGHTFSNWIVVTKPTCAELGQEKRVCAHCNEKEEQEIKMVEHIYQSQITDPTCKDCGYTTYTCTNCGDVYISDKTDVAEHTWGDWYTTLNPTTETEGAKQRVCNVCNQLDKASIPKITIPNGKSVSLNSPLTPRDFMIYPTEADFGEYLDHAIELYNAIMNGDAICNLYFSDEPFTDQSYKNEMAAYKSFEQLFETKVLLGNATILVDSFATGAFPQGAGLTEITILSGDICSFNEQCYKANISAGLYNEISEKEAVTKINNWICNNVSYVQGYSNAQDALTYGKAQCAGYAKLFYYMCKNANIECLYVTGCTEYADNATSPCPTCHAWNQVKIGDDWYYVDTCWNDTVGNKYLLSKSLWANRSINSTTQMW